MLGMIISAKIYCMLNISVIQSSLFYFQKKIHENNSTHQKIQSEFLLNIILSELYFNISYWFVIENSCIITCIINLLLQLLLFIKISCFFSRFIDLFWSSVVFYFQVTRNSFPRHLLAVVKECRISETLQSGFKKTGLFPFAPDFISSNVSKPKTPTSTFNLDARNQNLLQIGRLLEGLGIKESDRRFLLDSVMRVTRQQSIGDEIATALTAALLPSTHTKKPRKIDPRLALSHGACITELKFVTALAERADSKKKKREKRVKTNLVGPSIWKKKSPCASKSPSLPKKTFAPPWFWY